MPGEAAPRGVAPLPRAGAVYSTQKLTLVGASLAERGDAGQGHGQVLQRHGTGPQLTVDHGMYAPSTAASRSASPSVYHFCHVTAHSLPPGFLSQG